jgi:phosphoribosylaminoimidazolecarboxamide formyltransferase/IMP cyclohydrolase
VLDDCGAGALSDATRFRLAFEAFRRTAQYDAAIAAYLREPGAPPEPVRPAAAAAGFPERLAVEGTLVQSLRYGENPHQSAAFYRPAGSAGAERGHPAPRPRAVVQQPARLVGGPLALLEFDDPRW